MAEFIERELQAIKNKVNEIEDIQLITCVRMMVQVKIIKTEKKQLTMCFQFSEEYPRTPIYTELKSKMLPERLLRALTKIADEHAKTLIGQYQVLALVNFMKKFLEDNPLCVCHEEIIEIKKLLGPNDELKLKQKTSQIVVKFRELEYYVHVRFTIPEDYPQVVTKIEVTDHNFSKMLKSNFEGQMAEMARRCVEPPVRRRPKSAPFEPRPAVKPICDYMKNEVVTKYPHDKCPICGEYALPRNPKDVVNEGEKPKHVERTYCKHLYHYKCIDEYMKKPPFTGGKTCVVCDSRIYHNKWHISPELAEARWAHKEAKHRELDEVREFFD